MATKKKSSKKSVKKSVKKAQVRPAAKPKMAPVQKKEMNPLVLAVVVGSTLCILYVLMTMY